MNMKDWGYFQSMDKPKEPFKRHLVNTEVAEVAEVAEAMIVIFFSIQQWLYSGVSYYKGRSS